MNLRTGVDLIEIHRINEAIERLGDAFLQRVYTPAEIAAFAASPQSLAARWAAKEAVAKALGTGLGPIAFTDVEVLRAANGEPILTLHGKAASLAAELGISGWSISLSHTHEHAIAMVVGLIS